MSNRIGRIAYPILALAIGLGVVWTASAKDAPVLSLRAFAVNMSAPGRNTRTGSLDITIERWSSDSEREKLRAVLVEKGSPALLSALQGTEPRAGFIRTSTGVGWDIHYAREYTTANGDRRIVIATDRPMSYWEAANSPRSADYDFTLGEIRIPKDGKGTGKLVNAAKVSWNKDTRTIEIENYDTEPVRLTEVVADVVK
jgi:hypothetical protein